MATINIRVDGVIYDTVFCTAFFSYDEEKKEIKNAYLNTNEVFVARRKNNEFI